MATKTVTICDRCNAQDDQCQVVSVIVDVACDWEHVVDLCGPCMAIELAELVAILNRNSDEAGDAQCFGAAWVQHLSYHGDGVRQAPVGKG